MHSWHAAWDQPAGSQRHKLGAPGCAPVPAQVPACNPPPVPAARSVLVASLAVSWVLPESQTPVPISRVSMEL